MTARPVLAAHRWKTNAAMIADVSRLDYLDGHVLDATHGSKGGFWKVWQPDELTTNDLHHPADHAWDYCALPIPDASFDAVAYDPPYKLSGTPSSPDPDQRFGTGVYVSREARLANIVAGAVECYRVARRHLLAKVMDQVEGGRMRWQTDLVTEAIAELGGRKIDRFDLIHDPRPQPEGRTRKHPACKGVGCDDCENGQVPSKQQTALRCYSTLLVFQKPRRSA